MSQLTAQVEININAPAARVWEALTDPRIVKQYFFGVDMETDWEIGSDITYRGEWNGSEFVDKGTIVDIQKGKFIKMTYWSPLSGQPDAPENRQTITYSIEEENGVSRVIVNQDSIKSEDDKKRSEGNWILVLGQMKDLLEKDKSNLG